MVKYANEPFNWVNSNFDSGKAKKYKEALHLLHHLEDNKDRENFKSDINQEMNKENKFIAGTCGSMDEIRSKMREAIAKLPKGNNANPLRFWITTLNLDPADPNNKTIIEAWTKESLKFFKEHQINIMGSYSHWNEKSYHLNLVVQNWTDKRWGHSPSLSGKDGKLFLIALHQEHLEFTKDFCKRYNIEFKQEATTKVGSKVNIWRFKQLLNQMDEKLNSSDEYKRIREQLKETLKQVQIKDKKIIELVKSKGSAQEIFKLKDELKVMSDLLQVKQKELEANKIQELPKFYPYWDNNSNQMKVLYQNNGLSEKEFNYYLKTNQIKITDKERIKLQKDMKTLISKVKPENKQKSVKQVKSK